MSKRALSVGFLTVGLSAGVVAGAIAPAAAQGNPVGGSGNVYFLSGAQPSANGQAQKVTVFGNPGDEVYYGDWTGTGTDVPMVRRGNTFYISDGNGNTTNVFQYGDPGDRVIVGDWDGDGKDTLGVVRNGNHYFLKNSLASGTADTDFYYGNIGEQNILVGNWDGVGGDSIAVQRGNVFFIKNTLGTGVADFSVKFGDPSDAGNVLVGNWASNGQSATGGDQFAVKRGNVYFFSSEIDQNNPNLATTNGNGTAYGNADDTVFAAKLPTAVKDAQGNPVIDTVRPQTYAADQPATHKAGDPVLVWNNAGTNTFAQATDSITNAPKTYAGGENVTAMPGTPQVYRGGEGVTTADGKPVVYVAPGGTTDANHVDVSTVTGFTTVNSTTYTVPKYASGEPVLNADGTFVWVQTTVGGTTWTIQQWGASDGQTTKALPTGAANQVTVHVGDQLIRRAGQTRIQPQGSPAVYGSTVVASTDGHKAGDFVELHGASDYVLNSDGSFAKNVDGTFKTYGTEVDSTTAQYKAGDPILHRKGEVMYGYKWTAPVASRTVSDGVTNTTTTVTSATANFVAGDVGKAISGAGIPVGATIASVTNTTTAVISSAATATATGVSLTIGTAVAGSFGAAQPIMDDETPNMYTSNTLVNGAPDPSKSVSLLDANNDSNPAIYQGTEQYVTAADTPVSPFVGGETIVGHKAGDPVLDANGNVQMTGTGLPLVINGDGLGVRRGAF